MLVYVETNPWLMVIGSDSPKFALYEDGTVIFRNSEGFRTSMLSQDRHAALLDEVDISGLDPYYDLSPGVTDQPTSQIHDFRGTSRKQVFAYGAISRHIQTSALERLARAIATMRDFDDETAVEWHPASIEVMIWPYEYAPEPSIVWPERWPGLDDLATIHRGESSYSIFLPQNEREALFAFLKTRNRKGAVEIDGHKWSASLRYPFPNENLWLRSKRDRQDDR